MNSSERIHQGARTSTGQTAIEYLALLGVVVAVTGGIVAAAVGADITDSAHVQICRIAATTGGGGECADDNAVPEHGGKPGKPDPDEPVEPASAPDDRPGDTGGVPGGKPGDDKPAGKPDGNKGNALPSLCFEPRERSSNSSVSVPGNGPVSTAAAWGYSYLVNFVIDKVNNEKNKEKRVKQALDDLSYCLPDYNIVIAQPHEGNLQQMDGAAMIQTVEISGTTYRVYAFRTGRFTWAKDADLGWKNRAFKGVFDVSQDRRTVTFEDPPRPKRKKDWKPGDEGCQIEGQEPPDRSRYYDTYSPLDDEGSAQAVRMLVNDMRRCYPDYNVVAMHSEQSSHWVDKPDSFIDQSRYRLNSDQYHDNETGDDIASGRAVFDVYVFDKGKFSNDGDGGYTNWAYYGDVTRDGPEATFEQPEPADLDADSTCTGTESVDFDDGAPKYTDGGPYPGTDYSGKVPGDDAELNQSLVEEYSRSFPGTNIIAVKNFNDLAFSGVSGLEHLAVVDGVDVFAVKDGTIVNNGDGGWQNWGFAGHYEREEGSKEVVFSGS
ncbi:hypothetical protein [Streptomyces sp. RKAG290]|uniref:hypothetical protein n=1 Tax=Streptomyces sp. RKAG290 TaxID=2888348 RepID=UPI0020343531|nr:hypothetical protein [Streptomyces sp. RKAG290]MCM2412159.1 hypothetical protein [Streptomyces sp. RKAG290]